MRPVRARPYAAGVPASPFTDLDRPPLSARALQRALVVPGALWRRVDVLPETESTNADVAAAARAGEPEGLVVVAERQRAGRGRQDRRWVSPARAGLTFSMLLRPGAADPVRGWAPVPVRGYGWLPLLAGLAVVEVIHRLAELDATLKWPNDVVVRPRDGGPGKCAGILAEVAAEDAVVVGIGLNVTTKLGELPVAGPGGLPATSLAMAGGTTTDRDPLLRAILRALADGYGRWRDAGGDAVPAGLVATYRDACETLGRSVRVLLPAGGELTGAAVDVDVDGRLVVRNADGDHPVAAGDVVHVR